MRDAGHLTIELVDNRVTGPPDTVTAPEYDVVGCSARPRLAVGSSRQAPLWLASAKRALGGTGRRGAVHTVVASCRHRLAKRAYPTARRSRRVGDAQRPPARPGAAAPASLRKAPSGVLNGPRASSRSPIDRAGASDRYSGDAKRSPGSGEQPGDRPFGLVTRTAAGTYASRFGFVERPAWARRRISSIVTDAMVIWYLEAIERDWRWFVEA